MVAAHVLALIALVMVRTAMPVRPPESRTITAELLSPAPAPAPVQAPVQSPPKPVPPPPKPKVMPRPRPTPVKPVPRPVTTVPSPLPVAPPEPATPQPDTTTVATPPPTPSAPPAGQPTLQISGPKSVQHITCSIVEPAYPVLSRRRDETGTVLIHIVVDVRGKVESAVVKKTSGFDRLDEAARSAALSSPCTPYTEGGKPVRAMTDVPFRFTLND